jgi:hypothetical protein
VEAQGRLQNNFGYLLPGGNGRWIASFSLTELRGEAEVQFEPLRCELADAIIPGLLKQARSNLCF